MGLGLQVEQGLQHYTHVTRCVSTVKWFTLVVHELNCHLS